MVIKVYYYSIIIIIKTHATTHHLCTQTGDYVHMAYNYITALCLIQLQDKSSLPVMSRTLQQVLLISFVMGASIHMVADAVQHRLLRAGAKLHLTIQQQPMMQVMIHVANNMCIHSGEGLELVLWLP